MKNTTNAIQRKYMTAKAILETLEQAEKDTEVKYIADNHIINDDGTIPSLIYCIDNEEQFDKANAEMSAIIENNGLWNKILAARDALKVAEDNLIKYGLSLAPAKQRDILTEAVKTNYTTRIKVLDLALRLDVSTVR